MNVKDYLTDEFKRLNRRNDLLEKSNNKKQNYDLKIEQQIENNTLAMCEIARVLHMYY